MKKTILYLFIFVIFISLQAQVNYKIHENTYQKISISFTFGDLKTTDFQTDEGVFSRLYMSDCAGSSHTGEPELPVSVNILEIPIFGDYVLNVYGKDFVIYEAEALGINHPVYPAQPSVSKSHVGDVEFIQNQNIYQTDAFYALPLAKFEETGIMRNVNLGTLYVSPVQYNPVTNQIKIYKAIEVEILFKKIELVKTQTLKNLHSSPLFRLSNVINPMKSDRVEFSNTPIKYLIVAHSMFRGALDEFTAWKKRKGFLIEISYTDDENVGSTKESIENFIKSQYHNATPENPAPTFVLFVGDVEQIPAFIISTHPTDLYYFTIDENYLPYCYYGRFSAQNRDHLTPQIVKTLQYEQFTMPDPSYLDKICLIAGADNTYSLTYANGFVNYVSQNYATTEYGYADVYAHLHPCANQAAEIRAEIGAGVGIANYTAHGNTTGWYNPPFNNTTHIAAMNNLDKYGLMIGSCCESNKFSVNECFGEALLRAEGKGAVGYIGATDDTYWDEDYYWAIGLRTPCTANPTYDPARLGAYDKLFHTHAEDYDTWMTTFGAMIQAGNHAVATSTSNMKQYYREIYQLMGDPSIMTYLTQPSPMTVSFANELQVGTTSLTVTAAPYSYCALTNHREIVCAGFADADGSITFNFEPVEESDAYEFAAWAQKYIQYFKALYGNVEVKAQPATAIQVYPNPTTGELRVTSYELRVTSVEIFDVYGKKQKAEGRRQKAEGEILLDISRLPAGVYFLKITTENGVVTEKIIKN
jgi:hypothetical protein